MRSARILVVDDAKNVRRTLRMILGGEGFETVEAPSTEDALPMLRDGRLDLAILDVRCPVAGALAALTARLRSAHRSIPILATSVHARIADAAGTEGAIGFIEKPLDRQKLLAAVRCALAAGLHCQSSLAPPSSIP